MRKGFINKSIRFIAVLALVGNMALPAFAAYSQPAPLQQGAVAEQQSQMAAFFGKVLICTITGYKWVTLEDFQNGKSPAGQHKSPSCPLCTFAGAAIFPPGFAQSSVLWPPIFKSQKAPIYQRFHHRSPENQHSLSRAPPVLV